ncbi:MAG TPA: acyl-CoA thioesterase/bile acid-CoA:amino acid N-acyltransferase family protein [Candidatus Cybelea sp.]|nr:acyl-CoA thioesterase/bile acid-CoA:amino acid N-acyltransferase family protein [Candidatus Cybelea sp.]
MPHRYLLLPALTVGLFSWGVQTRSPSDSPQLIVTPESALFDTPVSIRVRMATPNSPVTLEGGAAIDGRSYRSWASFRTDASGAVDLAATAPLRGTYTGVDPMGLFWSMQPIKSHGYMPASLNPIHVHLTLYTKAGSTSVLVTRTRIASDVTRVALRGEPIVGTLFLPKKSRVRGAVIVLGGSEGGVDENRAAIIASHGFDTLALAYFGMNGLPSELANIPLEYVERGIAWVHERPETHDLPLFLEGDSKGAELALLVAARDPLVRGVVAFAPSGSVFEGFSTKQGVQRASWTISGAPVPFANNPVPPDVKAKIRADRVAKRPVSFREQYQALATPASPESTIAVEKIAGPLLLVAGADDQLWPSDVFARRIIAARKANGVKFRDQLLVFPGAGHEIDAPYMPTSDLAVFDEGNFRLALGGTAAGYARADARMWPKVLAFLDRLSASASDPAHGPFQPASINRSVPYCSAAQLRCL